MPRRRKRSPSPPASNSPAPRPNLQKKARHKSVRGADDVAAGILPLFPSPGSSLSSWPLSDTSLTCTPTVPTRVPPGTYPVRPVDLCATDPRLRDAVRRVESIPDCLLPPARRACLVELLEAVFDAGYLVDLILTAAPIPDEQGRSPEVAPSLLPGENGLPLHQVAYQILGDFVRGVRRFMTRLQWKPDGGDGLHPIDLEETDGSRNRSRPENRISQFRDVILQREAHCAVLYYAYVSALICAHILPVAVAASSNDPCWKMLRMFMGHHFASFQTHFSGAGVNRVENAWMLEPSLDKHWSEFACCLHAVDPAGDAMLSRASARYRFEWLVAPSEPPAYGRNHPDPARRRQDLRTGDIITLTTPDPDRLPLPNPVLFQIHAALGQLYHGMSGKADIFNDSLFDDSSKTAATADMLANPVFDEALEAPYPRPRDSDSAAKVVDGEETHHLDTYMANGEEVARVQRDHAQAQYDRAVYFCDWLVSQGIPLDGTPAEPFWKQRHRRYQYRPRKAMT